MMLKKRGSLNEVSVQGAGVLVIQLASFGNLPFILGK